MLFRAIHILTYLLGLTSLFFLPYVKGIRLVDCIAALLLFLAAVYFLLHRIKVQLSHLAVFVVFIFYYSVTIAGAVLNAQTHDGVLISLRYMMVTLLVFLLISLDKKLFERFTSGFIASALLNVAAIILDQLLFAAHVTGVSITEKIFSIPLLTDGVSHTITNYAWVSGVLMLRACGFSWDPGAMGPAIMIAYLFHDFRGGKLGPLFIIGILLTLSKTTIIFLAIYLFYKMLRALRIRDFMLYIVSAVAFSVIILASIAVPPYSNSIAAGNIRHIKYIASIADIVHAPAQEMFLGYGYRGVGEFFRNNVDWFALHTRYYEFDFGPVSVVESSFTNMLLYGGVPGIAWNLFVFFRILLRGERRLKIIYLFLVFLYIGYTFENFWTVCLTSFMLFSTLPHPPSLLRLTQDRLSPTGEGASDSTQLIINSAGVRSDKSRDSRQKVLSNRRGRAERGEVR
jgi:hypothetical protein